MKSWQEVLKKLKNRKVIIKDTTNLKAGYVIQEVGKDYVVALQNKKVEVVFNTSQIVSVTLSEELDKTTKKLSKAKTTREWESIKRGYAKSATKKTAKAK